jgi:hypothetical protein
VFIVTLKSVTKQAFVSGVLADSESLTTVFKPFEKPENYPDDDLDPIDSVTRSSKNQYQLSSMHRT